MSTNTTRPEINSEENKETRTNSSLIEQLNRQLKYLNNSAALFDQGDHDEAVRLATTLRVLFHNTYKKDGKPNSVSLLSQIGIKDKIRFIDTGVYKDLLHKVMESICHKDSPQEENRVVFPLHNSDFGLVEMCDSPGGYCGWQAPCVEHRFHPQDPRRAAQREPQPFKEWWNHPLIETSEGRLFNRKNLILIMANQDGGAHVDPKLDKDYNYLCTDNLGSWANWSIASSMGQPSASSPPPVKNNVAYASVRQITYEVCLSLSRHLGTPKPREGRIQRSAPPQPSMMISGIPVSG